MPLEIVTNYLEIVTGFLVTPLSKLNNKDTNIELLNALTKPLTQSIIQLEDQAENKSLIKFWCYQDKYKKRCNFIFVSTILPDWSVGLILFIVSLFVLCTCLIFLVKILSKIFEGKFLKIITKVINYETTGFKGYLLGYFTILVKKNINYL